MDGYSQTPKEERIKILRTLIPEAFTEGKIDFEKLRATLGDDVDISNERYVLNWAGKSDAFRVMQLPSSETLAPCRGESVNFDTTQNLFIEGENMEVLKILQRSYFGKVKMIYIDPPYNTGSDSFIYPDKFSETKEQYLRRVGDKNGEGYMTREGLFQKNSKENGQYHSNWLSMMMPRLYLAKSLLREDGVIFISIDDNEVHNLRLLMNEIFGEENFLYMLSVVNNLNGNDNSSGMMETQEYCLFYAKNKDEASVGVLPLEPEDSSDWKIDELGYWKEGGSLKATGINAPRAARPNLFFPIYINKETLEFTLDEKAGDDWFCLLPLTDGKEMSWYWSKEKFENERNEVIVKKVFNKNQGHSYSLYKKQRPSLGNLPSKRGKTTFYSPKYATANSNAQLKKLFGVEKIFPYSKSVYLIKDLVSLANTSKDDIVLDFFAGSATTAHAVMQINAEDGGHRKFIMVQLPEEILNKESEAFKAGYKTIAEIGKERIRRAGIEIKKGIEAEQKKQKKPIAVPDIGFKVFRQQESNFKQWRKTKGSDKEVWKQQLIDFQDPVAPNAVTYNMLYELLLKNGKGLNSSIEHKDGYYTINGKELVLMLDDSLTQAIVDAIIALQPEKVIALDRLFEGNDPLKSNTALQMHDAGIEFRTI